jgi:hypothetical protein
MASESNARNHQRAVRQVRRGNGLYLGRTRRRPKGPCQHAQRVSRTGLSRLLKRGGLPTIAPYRLAARAAAGNRSQRRSNRLSHGAQHCRAREVHKGRLAAITATSAPEQSFNERAGPKMKELLSATLVTLLLAISVAGPAAARCVGDEWTNEREDRPIWKCWDAGAG